jgi:hypothetical protein
MPNPTRSDVHVNAPLTNISIAHIQDESKFVASQVFPIVPVTKQSDLYFQYSQDDFLRSGMKLRAPGTETAGAGYGLSTASYSCDVFGLHKDVADQIRANADAPLDMDKDAAKFLTQQFLIKRDADFAATHFGTSTWTGSTTAGDITPGTKWDATSATPIQDIEEQLDSIEARTGYRGNTVVMGVAAMSAFRNSGDVVDRVKYTQKGVVTEDMIAGLLGVEKVVVARGIQNTALEGATAVYSRLFTTDSVLCCYTNPAPSLMSPSAGYTFVWSGFLGGGTDGQRVSRFRMDPLRSDRIEIEASYDQKLVSATLGAMLINVDT